MFGNSDQGNFDTEKLELAKIQNVIIEDLERDSVPIEKVSEEEVIKAIKKMKTGKSADSNGICAEHFKYGADEIVPVIVNIINKIFKDLDIPEKLKSGVVTPVLKPNKDKRYPENYRGIAVANTLSTIVESILKERIEPKLLPIQSKLQRGFTEKSSSLNTAFIVTRAAEYCRETSDELYIITLDAQKAFDRLNHELLFNKLYHDGICGDLWILLRNMYREVSVKVKWDNNLSKKVDVAQGIRQGAKLLTMLYKRYNNNILEALERSGMGAQIGNLRVVSPTCADDIAILACSKHEAQALLEIALILTDKDLVRINPTKTDLVPLTRKATNFELNMGANSIEQTNETKHLGLMRNSGNKIKVDERIRVGRKTIYALLGPGLHVRQGTCPTISYKIWKTYVIPRILYGVEVLNHTLTDIKKLERLQVQICKQIQGLPERTANLAAYSLLGVEPIELVVDRLTLTFLGNILQDKTTIEFQIVERQHAMMKTNTQNYANVITNILRKYRLPELYNILQDIPTKANWKKETKYRNIGKNNG